MTAPRRLRRSLPWVALGALVLAGPAAAHVEVTPTRIAPGASELLRFSAPDERTSVDVVTLTITLPHGFVLGSAEAKPGWTATVRGRTVAWRGGRIPPGQFAEFDLEAVAPLHDGSFTISAVERFTDGKTATYGPGIAVGPPVARSASGRDSGARTLGEFALGVALAAGLLALGGGFLALTVWMRSAGTPEEERRRRRRA